jgi:hypothetical protein
MTLGNLQEIFRDKKFWILVVIALVVLVVVIYSLFRGFTQPPFDILDSEGEIEVTKPDVFVVRVEPLPDQTGISTSPTIKVSFEKSIRKQKVQVVSSPKATFNQSVSSSGFYLTLTPKNNLKPTTKYSLSVLVGKTKIYSWSFTTEKKGADPSILEGIKKNLPYEGNHFRVSYSSATDKFYVTIDEKPIDKYKKAALGWFDSKGLPNAESTINIFYLTIDKAAD